MRRGCVRICAVVLAAVAGAGTSAGTSHAQSPNVQTVQALPDLSVTDCQLARPATVIVKACTDVIARHAKSSEAHAVRGNARRLLRHLGLAAGDLEKALELDAANPFALARRAIVYRERGEAAKEAAELGRLASSTPVTAAEFEARSIARVSNRDLVGALADLNKAVDREPKSAFLRASRGSVLTAMKNFELANVDFSKALELAPTYVTALLGRASAHMQQKQYAWAMNDASKAVTLDPELAAAWNLRGQLYAQLMNPEKALADYNKAIELDPKFKLPLASRGLVRVNAGDADNAIADASRAIELDAKFGFAYDVRGRAHGLKSDHARAIADFSAAIGNGAVSPAAYLGRGRALAARNGKNDDVAAISDLNKALELDKAYVPALMARGQLLAQQGNHNSALADFDKVVELEPKRAEAFAARSAVYLKMGAKVVAEQDRRKAEELDGRTAAAVSTGVAAPGGPAPPRGLAASPSLADQAFGKVPGAGGAVATKPAAAASTAPVVPAAQALLESARAHEKNRDYDKAIADLDKAIALNPKYTSAFLEMGYIHNTRKDFDKAITAFDKAIELNGTFAPTFASRGSAYAGKSNYAAAVADFNKSLELDPKYAYAYRNRASAFVELKEHDKAIVDLNKAIEIDPKSSFAFTIRGLAYAAKRDYEHGIADYDKAIELDPKSSFAHNSRGNAHYNKMDYDRALADYDKAIELDPKSAFPYAGRGAVNVAKRRPDAAKADYRQALAIDPANAFAIDGLRRLSAPAPKATPMPKSPAAAMRVVIVRSARADCGTQCPEWISAQGDIDADAPAQFRKVLKAIGNKKLPVFIDSGGGSVNDGYDIGRQIRAKGLDVFVTKTQFVCPDGDATCKDGKSKAAGPGKEQMFGLPQPHLAKCASSCAFVLASGVKRYVGQSSLVGVHQITSFQTQIKVWRTFRPDGTILSERKVSEKTVETKTANSTYTKARDFFTEMGISDGIMKLLRDAPANDMHWLNANELKVTGIATDLINGEQYLAGVTAPTWSDADQKGLVEARKAVHQAALAVAKTKPPADPAEAAALTLKIQKELTRVGCNPGKEDGKWGAGIKRALEAFTRQSGVKVTTDEPTIALFDTIAAKRERVCQ
jgi:tetratricopeptide (TPR) repeat protein